MTSFEELVADQQEIGQQIQTIIRNYKKDSAARKTTKSYFQERLKRLNEEWTRFEANDTQIRLLEQPPLEHEYFQKDYYTSILDIVQQYQEEFETSMLKLVSTKEYGGHNKDNPTTAPAATAKESAAPVGELVRLMRRQAAMMSSVERMLTTDFSQEDAIAATRSWKNIEEIHYKISEMVDEATQHGYNTERFIRLEEQVRAAARRFPMNTAQNNCEHNHGQSSSSTVPIPKITLPKFDGNYVKWKEFHDLFSSLIIQQPISSIQKMWYLKTHLVGEAANLIKHFAATGDNFEAAWSIVIDRYNNKRLLVSRLVQELVDGPIRTSSDNYKSLHDKTQECLLALQNLQINTATWDPLLLHLLLKRLDQATRLRYEQSLSHPREVPTIKEFLEFLERNFQSMEAVVLKDKPQHKAVSTIISANGNNCNTCRLCNSSNHKLYHCSKFLQLSAAERLQWTQRKGLCVNCFGSDHASKTCKSGSCRRCAKKHNTLLHLEKKDNTKTTKGSSTPSSASNPSPEVKPPNSEVTAIASATTNIGAGRQGHVLLATARVIITASNGISDEFRAILDSGSQVNIASKRLCHKLSISPVETSLCIDGVGEVRRNSKYRINIRMMSRNRNFSANVEAYVLPSIIPSQPSQHVDISTWGIPNNIHLADPLFYQQERVDLLLGAEFFFKLTKNGTIHLADDLPTLQNTALGWIVGGAIGKNPIPSPLCATTCAVFGDSTSLEEAIEQLWKLDDIESSEKILSLSEIQCETHFTQHVHTNGDGRFIVSLPFRENPTALGESHAMAYNRFMSLERRLQKDESIRTEYIKFMRDYERLGHMQKIDIDTVLDPKYIIPHHCVLKPDSTTTKLRVVFDASAKTSSGYSLNDLMYTGPNVQSELFSILLRFRFPRFVFTTDIEKMYRQILIHPDNHQYQLIIWREDPALPINYYQLNTVTYGTRAAPYLATKCLQKIADESSLAYPYGSQMLKSNFYMDDGLGGSDSLNVALQTQQELSTILKSHGFNLKKWCANHPQLLKNIPVGDQELDLDFSSNNTDTIKTLGLLWLPNTDHFCAKVKMNHVQTITKRSATSDLARLFDPLGLLAPVVINAKIFIQQLWQLKLDWDEPLPEDRLVLWTNFRKDLESLNNFKIPRHIFKGELPAETELHVFSDASERAFGAVAYIRATLRDKRVIVQLLCAKTRVAPLKRQTLPRLELCAAVMAAQLMHRIKMDLQIKNQRMFIWTDSEIVLSWINSQSSLYHTFVANRVSKIQSLSLPSQWRHVRSKDNPADILSRGLPARKLAECTLWLYGPMFLHGQEDIWPPQSPRELSIPSDLEKKKATSLTAAATVSNNDLIYKIPHRNSFKTLQRILGYVLRFIKNSRMKKQQRPVHKSLSPAELDDALYTIIRTIQMSDFSSEINQLRKKKEVDKNSPIITLAPFLDRTNILRVGGRLEASLLSYEAKHPMLIPYNDPIIKLLFTMVHEENKHCGPQALLNIIRQRFWPIKGKITARSTVQRCIRCVRARPQLCQQIMGNLPQARVTPARPFINTGVDYCGPVWIHYKIRGKRPTKAYIAVFCCFATKATHLEVVTDLTTEAFIGALKRFISRRGRCQNIYSDNATNFIGAKNQLSELAGSIYSNKGQEAIISAASSKGINFHFIPPRAPHFGGLWEAAVKSAKHLLLRSVASASLTQEEMGTIVAEIEAILNSRPLTPMSSDPNNLEALTPGHFLIGEALVSQVDSGATTVNSSNLSHWKLVSHLKHEFWKRWSTEYLNQLQQRQKWNNRSDNLKIGDMVIVKEDNLPVMKWPLARIVKTHPGSDNMIRVVEVKTANGIFKRPIHRIALLPIEPDCETPVKLNDNNSTSNALLPIDPDVETAVTSDDTNSTRNNNTDDPIQEPRIKRKRVLSSHLTLALITILLLLPMSFGNSVKNQKFGMKLGIHFEEIGTATISSSEWNILVYYDLGAYWSETSILINGTKSLQNLCRMITLNESCLSIIRHFEHLENDLQLENRLLRSKRGALNIVGNIANSLFGILDSEYANQISDTIQMVQENESHLLTLLKNQTSIVDSTMNIIKTTQLAAKARFEQLEQKIEELSQATQQNNHVLFQIQLTQLFNSGVLELNLVANNIRNIQSSILETLMNTHQGKISPLLLTPEQLQEEINQINLHIPTSVTLPIPGKDALLQLFKLMKVQGRLTPQHAVFKISLPLVEINQFKLFQLFPVPNMMNHSMIAIKPCANYMGITVSKKQYIFLTKAELRACDIISQDVFLCTNVQTRYNPGSEICKCEINLYNNKTTPSCTLEKTTTKWIPLNKGNQWIYATSSTSRATVVCNREISHLSLRGSGLLSLDPECILKHESVTMNGRQTILSTINSSYTSLGTISDLSSRNIIASSISNNQSTSTNVDSEYGNNIKELLTLQESLKEQHILDLPNKFKSHQQHNHTIGYLALGLSLIALIIIFLRNKTCNICQKLHTTRPVEVAKENIEMQSTEPPLSVLKPTPRSRQQPLSFALDV